MQIDVSARLSLEAIAADAGAVDAEAQFPRAGIDELARAGLLGVGLPQELGGAGGGPVEFVEVVEQVAGACASTGMVYVMHVVGAQTLLAGLAEGGAAEAQREALAAMGAGRHLTTLAYSDRGSRGHFWAQVSHAVTDGDALSFDADKTWATSAGHADSYILAVGAPNTDDPLSTELYLVPSDAPGITIPGHFDGLGMRGNASAPLRVRGLRLSAEQRLGGERSGFALMMTATLPWFALGSSACSVGIATAALDAAVTHATRARLDHEGSSLAQIPAVRARLAYARVRLRESRALVREVAAAVASDDPSAQEGVLAVKASAAEMAVEVTDLAMRVGGGAAYSKHGPLERHLRDARAAAVMAPTTELLHDFLGKAITGQDLF
jgi:alkylation response protein AidB-like acyl-CoA dehydrogenase